MSLQNIRKYNDIVSLFDEDIAYINEIVDPMLLYNGAAADYEDSADYLPRGFGKCTVIA